MKLFLQGAAHLNGNFLLSIATSEAPDWGQLLRLNPSMKLQDFYLKKFFYRHKTALPDLIRVFLSLSWPSAWLCSEVFLESNNPVSLTSTLTARKMTKLSKSQPYNFRRGQLGNVMVEKLKDQGPLRGKKKKKSQRNKRSQTTTMGSFKFQVLQESFAFLGVPLT